MRLQIEKLVHGGLGLARIDGQVILVEQVLPGEIVEGEIISQNSGILTATPKTIIQSSSFRQKPPCQYYPQCGGCDWQFIEYSKQVVLKEQIVWECFYRLGKFQAIPDIELYPSPLWHYRIRAQLHICTLHKALGFMRRNSNKVIAIKTCPILDSQINDLLGKQEAIFAKIPKLTKRIQIITGENSVHASRPIIPGFTSHSTKIVVNDKSLKVEGRSFFQANKFMLEKLSQWARNWIGGETLIDLYGGVGFFSVLLGKMFSNGILVEKEHAQVQLAKENLRSNHITNFMTKTDSVESYLRIEKANKLKADWIIIDPPRSGLSKTVRKGLAHFCPPNLLYYSCDPATLARDSAFLVNHCHYVLKKIALFDLYPQTHHIETAVLFQTL